MPKLHELLAAEGPLKLQAAKVRGDLTKTFKDKQHHFTEKTISFTPLEENSKNVVEEQLDLQTSVPKELKWVGPYQIKSLDASYQVAEANTIARADIILDDGRVLLSQVPVTSLLELEKRANELRDLIHAIPTLDPAKGFRRDDDRSNSDMVEVFKAREIREKRTKPVQRPLVLHPGTDKIPAQVQLITEHTYVGDIIKQEWSGLVTVGSKGDMLHRVEEFARAVKKARSRANDVEVSHKDKKIGAEIISYIFGQ